MVGINLNKRIKHDLSFLANTRVITWTKSPLKEKNNDNVVFDRSIVKWKIIDVLDTFEFQFD